MQMVLQEVWWRRSGGIELLCISQAPQMMLVMLVQVPPLKRIKPVSFKKKKKGHSGSASHLLLGVVQLLPPVAGANSGVFQGVILHLAAGGGLGWGKDTFLLIST